MAPISNPDPFSKDIKPRSLFRPFLIFSLAGFLCSAPVHAKKPAGIHHPVGPGVTLYRISQVYKVPIARIMEANRLSSPSAIKVGQKLFIPGAKALLKVEPFAPLSPAERKDLERSLEPGKEAPAAVSGTPGGTLGESAPPRGKGPDLLWPIQGKINSPYGPRGRNFHSGIDIASPNYQEVRAAMDGEVLLARDSNAGYGKVVVLRHDAGFSTVYGHLNVIMAREGEAVRQGEAIGGVGSTGNSTGPHLHFEVRQAGRAVNPLPLLPRTIEDLLEKANRKMRNDK